MKILQTISMVLILALFLSLGATGVQAQKGKGMMAQGSGYKQEMGPGYGYTQLTEEQQLALQDMYNQYGQELYSLRARVLAKKAELNAHMAAAEVDEAKVNKLVDEINELHSELFSLRTQMNVEKRKQGIYCFSPRMMGAGSYCPRMGFGVRPGGPGMGQGMMQHKSWGNW